MASMLVFVSDTNKGDGMPLTDTDCRFAKKRERPYKLTDGEGMYLFIQPSGSKLWRMAYRHGGKQKTLAFGVYPYVGLADARRKRTEAKTLLATGKDPATKVSTCETFDALARRWFTKEQGEWAQSHSGRLWSRIERDALPCLGAKPIDKIEPLDVLAVLRKVEDRGAIEVAKRLKQSMAAIFRLAIAEGAIKYNPCADIGDGLKPTPRVRHRTAMSADNLPDFIKRIESYQGELVTALALKFVIHTFVRTNELLHAEWSEMEMSGLGMPIWKIPAEKMKMRRDHIVPLSRQSLAILEKAKTISGKSRWVFPTQLGRMDRPLSSNTLIYSLYRLGMLGRATVHGFRSTASTFLNENQFNRDWVELQLAHVDGSIRGIYNAALYLPDRATMMQWWSDFLQPES